MMYSNDFNKLFDKIFNSDPVYYSSTYRLIPVDKETEYVKDEDYEINHVKDGAYLHFDVPGFNKENLEITIEGEELVLEGVRKYKLNGTEKQKSINKRVKLNNNYNSSTLEATIADGILTVYIPKYSKETEKRKNKVNIS
jgi:HSP20 family molecular chaperone IbpA